MKTRCDFFISFSVIAALLILVGCNRFAPVEEVSLDESKPTEELSDAVFGSSDWPWWRGPNKDGIAGNQNVPTTWSKDENIIWKTDIPGRGHSSPTVVDNRIFLTTADDKKQTQSIVCLDRESGKQLWVKEVHKGKLPTRVHNENSHASCTVACDGERLFVAFLNHDAIHASALDLEGKILWQKEVGSFDSKFGYSPSPALYKSLVIIAADHQSGGFLVALHRKTGEIVWRKQRPSDSTYSSPIVATVAGKDQLLISGANRLASYDPNTGEQNWSVKGTAEATCGTVIIQNDVVFASGGWPESDTLAVKADGSGKVLWRHSNIAYVTSMLLHNDYIYAFHSEQGIAYCWNAADGKEVWKKRLPGGKIRSSPVLVGENIFVTNVRGTTYVMKADPKKYALITKNQLGNECYATPTVVGDRIYHRVADSSSGNRKETLYCIGTTGAQ